MHSVTDLPPPAQARRFEPGVDGGEPHRWNTRLVPGSTVAGKRTLSLTALGRFTAFRQKYGVAP